jgi:hypothetical protein
MATQIKLRRDTYQNWYDANPTLAEGEPGYDLTNKKLKIGDGTTLWRVLPYFDDQVTDLSSYAGNIVPSTDSTYSLGSPSKRWNDAFLANNSVYIGDIKLSNNAGTLVVQQVTNAGLQTEAPVANPGTVTTDSLVNGDHSLVLTSDGTVTLDGQPFTAGAGGGDTKTWITTVSTGKPESRIMSISSVEYDATGNILALAGVLNFELGNQYSQSGTSAVIKLDPNGQLIWQYDLNDGSHSFSTEGFGIAQDSVGNIYVTGGYLDVDAKLMVVKLDSDASPVWSKTYSGYTYPVGFVVDVGADDHPVIVGNVGLAAPQGTECMIVKLDSTDGTIMWAKSLGGYDDDQANGMAVSRTDNSVVVVGQMNRTGTSAITAFDYGPVASNPNWTQNVTDYPLAISGVTASIEFGEGIPTITIGGSNYNQVVGTVFIVLGADIGGVTPNDNLEITVTAVDGNYDDHLMVAKYDSNGELQWQKALGIELHYDTAGSDADIDSDGNIYVLGSGSLAGGAGIVISKFNSSGQAQWTRTVQGDCSYVSGSIVVGDDDLLYISTTSGREISGPDGATGGGFTGVNTYLAKYNKNGIVQWQRELSKTNWYFSTGVWMGPNVPSGSNLDVKNGYIVTGNSLVPDLEYASIQNDGWNNFVRTVIGQTEGVITQLPSTGEAIDIGAYSFAPSRLPGVLAAPVVVDAELTETNLVDLVDNTVTFATTEINLEYGKVSTGSGSVTGDLTFDGKVIYNQTGITLSSVRGSLQFGHDLEAPGQSTHFHVNGTETNNIDYFFGDDYNYLKLNSGYQGVTIGANNNDGGGQKLWSFGTNGELTLPDGTVIQSGGIQYPASEDYEWDLHSSDGKVYIGSVGDMAYIDTYSPNIGVRLRTNEENDWLFKPNGNLQLPVGGDIVDSTGTSVLGGGSSSVTTGDTAPVDPSLGDLWYDTNSGKIYIYYDNSWVDSNPSGPVFGIADFGEGFSLTATDKVVTNKLYSTNATQPTQHYRLELDTNGVVILPDQSIINGSTLRGVPGTGGLNYTGITIGPNSGNPENTWMWVDASNAYISTDSGDNAYTWTFGVDGITSFPSGAGFARGDNGQLKTNGGTTAIDLRDASGRGFYTNNDGFSLRGNGSNTWTFGTNGSLTLPGGSAIGYTPSVSTDITVNNKKWAFDVNGTLTVPGNISAQVGNNLSIKTKSVTDIAIEFAGSGYPSLGGLFATTGGSGTGMTVQVYGPSGSLEAVSIGNPGLGYLDGDVVNVVGGNGTVRVRITQGDWTFGTDGTLTVPGDIVDSEGVSIYVDTPDNKWIVDPSNTATYTADGSVHKPFKTITAALAYIEVLIAAGQLTQFDPTANIVLSPQFIVLLSSTTENVTLTRGHIYIVGDTPDAGHVPIWIQGHVTITPGGATKAINDFGLFNVAVLPTGNFHGVKVTGSAACRVYLENVYVYQGTSGYSCVYMDNSDASTKLEMVDCTVGRASGSTHLVDIQSAYCKIDNLETNGQGQALNFANAAAGTILNSVIDAGVGAVITLSGTAQFGMGNCILNNTSAAANSYGVSMSGTASMQFGVCTFNVPAAQATNRAINGVAGNVVLYTGPVFQYGSTNKISTEITLVPLTTTFTAV